METKQYRFYIAFIDGAEPTGVFCQSDLKHQWQSENKNVSSILISASSEKAAYTEAFAWAWQNGFPNSNTLSYLEEVCNHGFSIDDEVDKICWKCKRLKDWKEGKLQIYIANRWRDWSKNDIQPTFDCKEDSYRRKPESSSRLVEWPVVEECGILICKTHNGRSIGRASKAECQIGFRGWKFEGQDTLYPGFWASFGFKIVHATAAIVEVKE